MLQFRPPAATARDDTLGRLKPEAEAPRARPLRRPDVVMDQHHPIRAGAAIKLHVHLPKVVGAPRNRGERNDAHITLPSACLVPSPQCRLLEVPPAWASVSMRAASAKTIAGLGLRVVGQIAAHGRCVITPLSDRPNWSTGSIATIGIGHMVA